MAEHFRYRDDWKTRILTCSCGWTGTFEEGSVEHFEALMHSECPRCGTMLAIVSYPVAKQKKTTRPPVVAEAAPSPSTSTPPTPNLSTLSPSRLQAIRANLSSGWVLEQQLLAELREEQAARDPQYLAELAELRRGLPPLPRKRRTRKRRH